MCDQHKFKSYFAQQLRQGPRLRGPARQTSSPQLLGEIEDSIVLIAHPWQRERFGARKRCQRRASLGRTLVEAVGGVCRRCRRCRQRGRRRRLCTPSTACGIDGNQRRKGLSYECGSSANEASRCALQPESVQSWAQVHERIVQLGHERAKHEREMCRLLRPANSARRSDSSGDGCHP